MLQRINRQGRPAATASRLYCYRVSAMIASIITYLLNNRLARFIGGALAAIASVLTFGAVKRRQGAQEAKAQAAADAAKTDLKNERTRNEIDDNVADGTAVERLRRDWTRK